MDVMDSEELDSFLEEIEEPRKNFDKLTPSEQLYYIARYYNWDNGIAVLQRIAENKLCSEATALMLFWRALPTEFLEYDYDAGVTEYGEDDAFTLVKTIMENYKHGFYQKTSIKYDPKEDMPKDKPIPEIMLEGTNGEEPYIYYEDLKVNWDWSPEQLEGQIERCENPMDLYNIAYLLREHILLRCLQKILGHRHCDKGIALMLYWKYKRSAYVFDEQMLINKIKNNEYKETIRYNPRDHKENEIDKELKWEIPEIMKKAV